jgi:hypothetical protein
MMQRSLFLAWSLLVLVPAGGVAADKDTDPTGLKTDVEYYPLALGMTWTYKEATSDKKFVVKVTKYQDLTIKKDGQDAKVRCARLETTEQGKTEAIAIELVTVDDKGMYRCKLGDTMVVPPARILALPIKKGDNWSINSKVGNQSVKVEYTVDTEQITLLDKKYDTLRLNSSHYEVDGKELQATIWYGKGVGMVKLDMTIGTVKLLLELEKFETVEKSSAGSGSPGSGSPGSGTSKSEPGEK